MDRRRAGFGIILLMALSYRTSTREQRNYKRRAGYLVAGAMFIAIYSLVGWQFGIAPIMHPLSSICFVLSGAAFFLLEGPSSKKLFRRAGLILGSLPILIGAVRIIEIAGGFNAQPDFMVSYEKVLEAPSSTVANHLALNTAFNFILIGLVLVLSGSESRLIRKFSAVASILNVVFALLALIGQLYGVKELSGVLSYIPVSIYTAIALLLFGFALIFVNTQNGFLKIIFARNSGGTLARMLIPAAILIPFLLGYLRLYVQWKFPVSLELGTSFLITGIIFLFFILIVFTTVVIQRNDQHRKEAEQRRTEINARLELVNKELEAFTYSVAHDLRAPLRIINGFCEILLEDYLPTIDENGQRTLQVIVRNAKKMGQLIDDLLEFSRVGRAEIRVANLDMNLIVTDVITDLSANTVIPSDIQIGSLPIAKGDHNLIRIVWGNLLSNAIKYSSKLDHPRIEIGSKEEEDGTVVYHVKDNGAGFEMVYANKLFGVFQRLHKQEEFAGTGVGLALVQRIVVRHGGKIWAESELNKGATFSFTLSGPSL